MFSTKGASSYGKGIASNLVTEEQRQKYNSGGRVGLYHGGPHDYSHIPSEEGKYESAYKFEGPQGYDEWYNYEGEPWKYDKDQDTIPIDPISNFYSTASSKTGDDLLNEWGTLVEGVEIEDRVKGPYLPGIGKRKIEEQEKKEAADLAAQERMNPERETTYPIKKGVFDKFGMHRAFPGEEEGEEIVDVEKEDTETLTVDPFGPGGFMDEHIAKKKQLGRGKAFMDAAAAAAEWATAGTKKEKGAAIAKGLRGVGEAGTKFQGAAEDLKVRAKTLAAIEDIKGKHKMDVWKEKMDKYYGPSITIAEEGLELKKEAARLLAEGDDGKSIYNDILRLESKSLRDPFTKRDIIRSLTGKELEVEGTENKKALNSLENEGLIFIDLNGDVVRNTGDGKTKKVDETTDEFFTWRK